MNEVTHQECGGTVSFTRRHLPSDADGETTLVLVCHRCEAVITSTDDIHPKGAVCGVAMRDVREQRSAA